MPKRVEDLSVQILRQIRDALLGLNGRVDGLNERVDALTAETRDGFTRLRQELHTEVAGQRRAVEARLSFIERRLGRLETKKK